MGLRISKRINLGSGLGLNVSKSGIAPSVRTPWGAVGTRGVSVRSGIPGVSYRSGASKDTGLIVVLIFLIFGVFIIAYYLIKFLFNLIIWLIKSVFQEDGISLPHLSLLLGLVFDFMLLIYLNMDDHTKIRQIKTSVPADSTSMSK